jgi:peptidoglycan/LPS O-acetylase OafA/YrhL
MSVATPFFTYLWHYLVARLLYDDLVRPLVEGRLLALLPLAAIAALALLAYRALRRTRSRRRR